MLMPKELPPVNLVIVHPSMCSVPTLLTCIPLPLDPNRLRYKLRNTTTSEAPALIETTSPITAVPMAAWTPGAAMRVSALSTFAAPYGPDSSATITPPAAVLGIAPLKKRQGVARPQLLASLPDVDTNVCKGNACTEGQDNTVSKIVPAKNPNLVM